MDFTARSILNQNDTGDITHFKNNRNYNPGAVGTVTSGACPGVVRSDILPGADYSQSGKDRGKRQGKFSVSVTFVSVSISEKVFF